MGKEEREMWSDNSSENYNRSAFVYLIGDSIVNNQ